MVAVPSHERELTALFPTERKKAGAECMPRPHHLGDGHSLTATILWSAFCSGFLGAVSKPHGTLKSIVLIFDSGENWLPHGTRYVEGLLLHRTIPVETPYVQWSCRMVP